MHIYITHKVVSTKVRSYMQEFCQTVKEQSNVVYRVDCKECLAFYVGMTTRQLSQRLKELKCQASSALYRHGEETQHEVDFQNPIILDKDTIKTRLLIKESLHIQDYGASKSLNRNLGSFEARLCIPLHLLACILKTICK